MLDPFNFPPDATPIYDYSGLKPSWVFTQQDLNRAEAENILTAQRKYFKKPIGDPIKWFSPGSLKKIHEEMYGDVWGWAGIYRKAVTSIGIKPYLIPAKLAELCSEVQFWLTDSVELTFLEQAARIHHRLVFIHPFENGNGRFSRLVADRYLLYWGHPYPCWPVDLQNTGFARDKYINCLKNADQGDYGPLINFMRNLGVHDLALSQFLGSSLHKNKLNDKQRLAMVKALLRMESQVNEAKNKATSSFHIAIQKNYNDIALLLLEHKADMSLRDSSGYNPFERAISVGNFEIAMALYQSGYPYIPEQPPSAKLLKHQAKLGAFKKLLNEGSLPSYPLLHVKK